MVRGRRYPLTLRVGLVLRVLGTLLLVAFLIYVGSAVYYAFQISAPSGSTPSVEAVAGNGLEISSTFNLTDPGPYAISGLTLESHLELPNESEPVESLTPPVSLPGYGTAEVNLTFRLPMGGSIGTYGALLINNTSLPLEIWVNASYAHLAAVSLFTQRTLNWGAPFSGFAVSFQAPRAEPNGTVAIPFAMGFLDAAPLALRGALTVALHSAGGATCTTFVQPVQVAEGIQFSGSGTVYLPSGCSARGGAYSTEWSGSGFQAGLPVGRIS